MLALVFALALAAQDPPAGDPPPPPSTPPSSAPPSSAPATEPPSEPAPSEPRPIEPRDDAASNDDASDAEEDAGDDEGEDDGDHEDGEDEDDGIEIGALDDDDDRTLLSESRLTLGGRLGAAGGNLAVPFFLSGPGAFLTGSQRVLAFELFYLGGDGGLLLGNSEKDLSIAGYRGRLSAGLSLPIDIVTLEGELHAGITSVALVPVPRMGVGGAIKIALPVADFMTLDAEGRGDLDFLVIVPAPAASLEGGATFWLGDAFFTRVRAGIDADAVIGILANSVSASVFLSVTAGLDLTLLD